MKHKKLSFWLYGIVLVLLILPLTQSVFSWHKEKPLMGAITEPEVANWSWANWMEGTYQLKEEKYVEEKFGFRNYCIRIQNQLAFTFFKQAKANGVLIGKENYLYEKSYIDAYFGNDFVGEDSIQRMVQQLRIMQDSLSKYNKSLLLVFAAGKGSFYPEYFLDEWVKARKRSNYSALVENVGKSEIPYIDFNRWFLSNKKSSPYPLYPKYGIHWSHYGACVAADSIIGKTEALLQISMLHPTWDKCDVKEPVGVDYDIADGMNLLFRLPSFPMAYPQLQWNSKKVDVQKPSVLVVADSYFWDMYNYGFGNAFSTCHFWYYNAQVYPESAQKELNTADVDVSEALNKHDVMVIMATEATQQKFGWGFINRVYKHIASGNWNHTVQTSPTVFQSVKEEEMIRDKRNYIQSNPEWMRQIKEKAIKAGISEDSMLTLDVIWLMKEERKKAP